jgi:hypothetical protein
MRSNRSAQLRFGKPPRWSDCVGLSWRRDAGFSICTEGAFVSQVDFFRIAPPRIDSKLAYHFLQADFSGLIGTLDPDTLRLAECKATTRRFLLLLLPGLGRPRS